MNKRLFVCALALSLAALIGVARAVLLGVTVIPPVINYNTTTSTSTTYNPVSEVFSVVTTPTTVQFSPTGPTVAVAPTRSMTINIKVDNNGNLVGSVGPGPDLVISGKVTQVVGTTTNVYSGLLLTGQIYAFGYGSSGGVSDFDFRFHPTGGLLEPLYTCDHIGVFLTSELSTFTGSFTTNFHGEAKGSVGLEDLIPPTVTCPSNVVLQCNASSGGQHGAFYTYPAPIGSDNCSTNLTFIYSPPSGSFFALDPADDSTNYTVTLTAIDASGNSNSCSFTVTVEDTVPPVLVDSPILGQCEEAPFVLTNDVGECYATFTFEIPTAVDQCCTNGLTVTVSAMDESNAVIMLTNNGDGTMTGHFPVTCTGTDVITSVATDGRGNTSQALCDVLVVDDQPPVIQNCSNQVVECTANTPAGGAINFELPTAFDNCPNVMTSCVPTNGSVLPLGTNLVVFTASDCSGNTNSCTFDVIVVDTNAPTITCPVNVTLSCGQSTNASFTGTATATDTCDPNPSVTFSDSAGAVNCTGLAAINRTWTATDASGNSASCMQSITFTNTTAPTVTVPTGSNLGCNPTNPPTCASVKALVTATPACGTATITVTSADTTNGCTITRTFTVTATDGCGNTSAPQTVVYSWTSDTTAPVFTALPSGGNLGCNPASLPNTTTVQAGVTATASCGTPTITVTSATTGSACAETNTFTITATDSCGLSTVTHVVYTWTVDTTAPVFTALPSGGNLGCNPASLPNTTTVQAGVTATASCGTPTITVTSATTGSACAETNTFTITATDSCGLSTVTHVVYTWTVDTTAPVFTALPSGGNLGCNPASLPTVTSVKSAVTATATCGTPTIKVTSATTGSACAETNTFTITATDSCGLSTVAQVVYTWTANTTAPSITCPAGVTVQCASNVPAASVGSVIVSASCGTPTVTWVGDVITNQTCPNRYTVLRTYKAVDPCGNSAACTQTITVNDTIAPSITCPTNITVVASSLCSNSVPASTASIVAFLHGVTATDNCGSGATVTNNAPSTFSMGTNTVKFTATDSCGNTSSCQASVIVVSTPVTCHPITCAPTFCQHHFDNYGNCQFATFEGNLTLSDGDQPSDFRTSSNSYYTVSVTIGTNVVYCKTQILANVGDDGCGGEAWEYFGNNSYERAICRFTDNQCYNALMDPNMPLSSATKNKNCGQLSTVNIGATSTRFYCGFQNASQPLTVVCDGIPICSVSNNVATSTFPFSQSGTTIQCTFPDRLVPGNTLQWYACGNPNSVSSNCLLYTQQTCASNNATATYYNEGGTFEFQCPTSGFNFNGTNRQVCVTIMIGQPGVTAKVACGTFCETLGVVGYQDWQFGNCSQFQDEFQQESNYWW